MKSSSEDTYFIELTHSELYWLASAFGYTRLALPLITSGESPADRLADGKERLVGRDLIRHYGSARWQVESILAVLIRWLGDARQFTVLNYQPRQGQGREFYFFVSGERGLTAETTDKVVGFRLFPNRAVMIDAVLNELGIPFSDDKVPELDSIGILQPLNLIRLIWKDPAAAEKVLKAHRKNRDEISQLFAWANTIRWVAEGAFYKDLDSGTETRHLILAGSENQFWTSSITEEYTRINMLKGTTFREVRESIMMQLSN